MRVPLYFRYERVKILEIQERNIICFEFVIRPSAFLISGMKVLVSCNCNFALYEPNCLKPDFFGVRDSIVKIMFFVCVLDGKPRLRDDTSTNNIFSFSLFNDTLLL